MTRHNPPTAPLVYYAEPIDLSRGRSHESHLAVRALTDCGLVVYRPATAWAGGHHHPKLVERVNRDMLYSSDLMVADLRDPAKTTGIPMEIEAALSRGIPVVVIQPETTPRPVSLQAAGVHWAHHNAELTATGLDLADRHYRRRGPGPDDLRVVLAEHPGGGLIPMEEPSRAYDDDAGYDLITSETTVIEPGRFTDVPTTVTGVQLPPHTWGLIIGRSSTLRKRGLMVNQGVIDFGWRGPLFAGVWNLTDSPVKVEAGERLAQLIIMPNRTEPTTIIDVVDHRGLDAHPRGTNGFGSSGGHGAAIDLAGAYRVPAGAETTYRLAGGLALSGE